MGVNAWRTDSAYGVRFPEVLGCFSAADTSTDIVPGAVEALSLFFEETERVAALGLERVRELVADEIADGVGVPAGRHGDVWISRVGRADADRVAARAAWTSDSAPIGDGGVGRVTAIAEDVKGDAAWPIPRTLISGGRHFRGT